MTDQNTPYAQQAARTRLHGAIAALLSLCIALTGWLALPASAAPPAAYASAMAHFQRAVNGDDSAIEPAANEWRALSTAEPTDPLLRAYAGASTSMLAKTTLLPWRKMGLAEDGLALIDKALAQLTPAHDAQVVQGAPVGLHTRFVAASTFLALPSMLNRGARGAKLLDEVAHSPSLAAAEPGSKEQIADALDKIDGKKPVVGPVPKLARS